MARAAVIVGIGETPMQKKSGKFTIQLQAEAALQADVLINMRL